MKKTLLAIIQFPFAFIYWASFVFLASAYETTAEYDMAKSLAKVLGLTIGAILRCIASWFVCLVILFIIIGWIQEL